MKSPLSLLAAVGWRLYAAAALALAALAVGSLYTPYPAQLVRALRGKPKPEVRVVEKIVEKRVEVPIEVPVEVRVEVPVKERNNAAPQDWQPPALAPMPQIELPPFPPALPQKMETGAYEHFTALAKGLHLHSTLTFQKGSTATQDRKKKQAYMVKVGVELMLPHAADGRELLHANPHLPHVLARYDELMAQAKVSPWFHSLYLHKQNSIRKNLAALSQPLDRHNFYDTDTILELTAPGSHRRALWIQADMDVVSDGSDGDRLPTMPESIRKSDHYQPTTSYRWKKRTKTPNPLLAPWEARLARHKEAKNAAGIDFAQRVVFDLKRYSYLLAQYDPFIVIPLTLKEGRNDAYRPKPGDYAVVIVGKKVVPAIVGDYGPKLKAGEASLRLGKLVNPKAGVYARPVSSLEASYIIFPHSAEEEPGPIDYARLNSRCRELLAELGGLGPAAEYVEVEDLLAPKPPPAPPEPKPEDSPKATSSEAPAPEEGQTTNGEQK